MKKRIFTYSRICLFILVSIGSVEIGGIAGAVLTAILKLIFGFDIYSIYSYIIVFGMILSTIMIWVINLYDELK